MPCLLAAAALLAGCGSVAPRHDGQGFRIPTEFEPLGALWLGWDPGHEDFSADLAAALQPHVRLKMLVRSHLVAEAARSSLRQRGLRVEGIEFVVEPQAMYFVRDAAVFASAAGGRLGTIDFRWNQYGLAGWCDSRDAGDPAVAARCVNTADLARDGLDRAIAASVGGPYVSSRLVMEGGGVEVNGQGLLIANEALVRQRNPDLSRAEIERELLRLPGIRKVIWLPAGLAEDPLHRSTIVGRHVAFGTGGHTDEFVRFADPGTVLLAWPDDADADTHPVSRINRERMQRNFEVLAQATDVDGRPLRVLKLPLPRPIERPVTLTDRPDQVGARTWAVGFFPAAEQRRAGETVLQVASASYLNFVVANNIVVLPDYLAHGTPWERQERVRQTMEQVFPGRQIRFIDAMGANWVGGGPHCAVLPEPAALE